MEWKDKGDRRLQLMIDRHRTLNLEADKMSARKYLLPEEHNKLKQLKLMRLRAKRAIDRHRLNVIKE